MKWEYFIFDVSTAGKNAAEVQKAVNKHGEEGWELVAVATTETDYSNHLLYFKRPKQRMHGSLKRGEAL